MSEEIKEEQYWKTAEGKVIAVADMTESHAKNCLRLMLKHSQKRKAMANFEKRAALVSGHMREAYSQDELCEFLFAGTIDGKNPEIPEIFERLA